MVSQFKWCKIRQFAYLSSIIYIYVQQDIFFFKDSCFHSTKTSIRSTDNGNVILSTTMQPQDPQRNKRAEHNIIATSGESYTVMRKPNNFFTNTELRIWHDTWMEFSIG